MVCCSRSKEIVNFVISNLEIDVNGIDVKDI